MRIENRTEVVLGILAVVSSLISIYTAFGWWPAEDLRQWLGVSHVAARGVCIAVPLVLLCGVFAMMRFRRNRKPDSVSSPLLDEIAKRDNSNPLSERTVLSRFGDAFNWFRFALWNTLVDIVQETEPSLKRRRGHAAIIQAVQKRAAERAAELEALAVCTHGDEWKAKAEVCAKEVDSLSRAIKILNKWAWRSVPLLERAAGCLCRSCAAIGPTHDELEKRRRKTAGRNADKGE